MAVWVCYIALLIFLTLPYIIIYHLPYGFITEKSFTQMPTHIILIGNASNFIIFSIPIITSVVIYKVLTREVKKRISSEQNMSVHVIASPINGNGSQYMKDSKVSEISYSVEDLPYPLNILPGETQNAMTRNDSDQHERGSSSKQVKRFRVLPTEDEMLEVCNAENLKRKTKKNAEIESALRSLKTNLLMLLMFIINCFILFLPSPHWKLFIGITFESILKFMLPTVTTVANFGPIKDVVKMYLQTLDLTQIDD